MFPKKPKYQNIPQEKPDSSKQDFFQILYSKMSLKKKEKKTSENPKDDDYRFVVE